MDIKEMLTNLQEAYATHTQMGLYILSNRGEYITTVTGIDALTEYLFIHDELGFRERIDTITQDGSITKPYIYPIQLDGKVSTLRLIIVPIIVEEKVISYILTNVFQIATSATEVGVNNMLANVALNQAKRLTSEQIYDVTEQLQRMANICSALFAKEIKDERFDSFYSCLAKLNAESGKISEMLSVMYHYDENIENIMFVQLNRQGQWLIQEVKGKHADLLKTVKLDSLAGLLDETRELRQSTSVENIQFDPRLAFLYNKNIRPKSIYFFPVAHHLENKEMIITISESKGKLPPFCIQTAAMMAEMLALFQSKKLLRTMGHHFLSKISRVIEMSKLMLDLKSVQELLFLILDMTDHLMKSTFVTVILKDRTNECLHCNQLSDEQIHDYIEDVWKQQLKQPDLPTLFSRIRTFSFGTMIECPIIINQQVEAIFCIRTDNVTKEMEAYTEILANLLSIGLGHFLSASHEQRDGGQALHIPESILKLLTKRENEILEHMLKGYNNQEIAEALFISAHTVKNHISNIFQKLNITDRRQLFSTIYQMQFYT